MHGFEIAERPRPGGAVGPRRVALATGGTAGHVTPAIAVADAYRAARPEIAMLFLGSASGFERRLVAAHGYDFETIPAAPLYGVTPWRRLRTVSHLAAGVRSARRVLARDGVQLVIGFGGYASAGAVLAARSLGLAVAVHDANVTPGLANRLLGHVADRILLGWDGAAQHFAAGRSRCTGTPIRSALAALVGAPRRPPEVARARLLVCGGSQGSPFLNRHAPELAGVLRDAGIAVEVRHVCGREPLQAVRDAYAARGVAADVQPHVHDIAAAYRWADLAVACAGAVALAELSAAGLPALLVPLAAAAHDHQASNAAVFAAATGAPWVREEAWDATVLGAQLAALLGDRDAWRGLSERIARLARADAAAAVVAECEALLGTEREAPQ